MSSPSPLALNPAERVSNRLRDIHGTRFKDCSVTALLFAPFKSLHDEALQQKVGGMLADQQFVSQLRDRADSAIQELFDQYYTRIYRYLTRLVDDPEVAADLSQDTFLKAYSVLPELPDETNVRAWLFTIATNLARSYHRRRRLINWIPLGDWHTSPASDAEQIAQRDAVDRALEALTREQRTCLLLQTWGGLNCSEIAQAIGKSESAVKMILFRARRQFREVYQDE